MIMYIAVKARVFKLLLVVPREPGTTLPDGASDDNLAMFTKTTGLSLPSELVEWLKLCNGPCVGPGGLYGIAPAREFLRIEAELAINTEWKQRNWLPVAGDGTGNYYIIDANTECNGSHPIFFLDHEVSLIEPVYIVASNLWTFLLFILQSELDWENSHKTHWPFEKEYVLSIDPELEKIDIAIPLPWETV